MVLISSFVTTYKSNCSIPGTMTAYQDAWFIGDNFLREIFNAFVNLRNHAGVNRKRPPYLYDFYNIFGYFQNRQSMVLGMTRLFNSFVETLNNRLKLPKYIFMILDGDLLDHTNAVLHNGENMHHAWSGFLRI